MSAPRTNLAKQKQRHRGPLIGMALVALFGVLLIVYWIFEEAATADDPQGGVVQGEEAPAQSGDSASGGPITPEASPAPETIPPENLPTAPSDTPAPTTGPVND